LMAVLGVGLGSDGIRTMLVREADRMQDAGYTSIAGMAYWFSSHQRVESAPPNSAPAVRDAGTPHDASRRSALASERHHHA